MLYQRVLVALVGLPLIVGLLFRWPTGFAALLALALLGAAWEYRTLWPADARWPAAAWVVSIALPLLPRLGWLPGVSPLAGLLAATLLDLSVALALFERGHGQAPRDAAYAALGALMFGGLGGMLLALQDLPWGPWAVLWVLSTVWVADSAAYFAGRAWGRHRLAPRLSPKKTWEGYWGGVVAGFLLALLLGAYYAASGRLTVSLGQAAFLGVGAYAASHLAGPLAPLGILLGGAVAAAIGVVLGLPSLRIKGVYLAIATMAFQFLALWVFNNWEPVTGGIRGRNLPPAEVLGLELDRAERLWYLVLAFAVPLFFYGKRLLATRAGRAWFAVRDNDLSAQVAGVNLTLAKLSAFALSAFYAGIAGGLLANLYRSVTPEYFLFGVSVQYLAMVIVGGAGTVLGAVLGAVFVMLIPELLNAVVGAFGPEYAAALAAWRNVAFGGLILLFLILEPLGLVGLWGRIRAYLRTWPLPY